MADAHMLDVPSGLRWKETYNRAEQRDRSENRKIEFRNNMKL